MTEQIPKPWEEGYSVDLLPSQPRTHSKFRTNGCKDNAKNFGARAMKNLSPEERKLAKEKEKRTREAKKKKQHRLATRRNIGAKHLRSAAEVLEEHNFDPMDLLMDVAQGKALYDDHPFLLVLHRYLDDAVERIDNEDGFGVKGLLHQLRVESWGYLKDSYTPKEHRIKVAMELQKYTRPMMKQIEHTGGANKGPVEVVPLSQEEVTNFKEWFDENF